MTSVRPTFRRLAAGAFILAPASLRATEPDALPVRVHVEAPEGCASEASRVVRRSTPGRVPGRPERREQRRRQRSTTAADRRRLSGRVRPRLRMRREDILIIDLR
jgi:hypothetical protein